MKILFDQGVPVPLRRFLHPHLIDTAAERGWSQLQNGDLLAQAESNRYDLFITTDKNLRYQQNLASRVISILVLSTTSWPRIRQNIPMIQAKINVFTPKQFEEIIIP